MPRAAGAADLNRSTDPNRLTVLRIPTTTTIRTFLLLPSFSLRSKPHIHKIESSKSGKDGDHIRLLVCRSIEKGLSTHSYSYVCPARDSENDPMKMKTIGVLNVDGTSALVRDEDSYTSLQKVVGGNIETVHLPHFKGQVYANEEGLLVGLPFNAWSDRINYQGGGIVGPMVVCFSGRDVTAADLEKLVPTGAALVKAKKLRAMHESIWG